MNHIYGDEDHYQPPQMEMIFKPSRISRPASSYWLMILFASGVFSWGMSARAIGNAFGVHTTGLNMPTLTIMAFFVGLVALILGARKCWGHHVAAVILAVHLARCVVSLFADFSELWAFSAGFGIFLIFVTLLKFWLFHRFTFGLPSRRYYGMASVSQD